MDQYKSNSNKSKEREDQPIPEKRVEKMVTGPVKHKKKGELQKFADIFISEDMNNVKSYVFMDVLVPAIKKAVSDIVTNGIDMVLYGETGCTKKNSVSSKVSYRGYYDRSNDHRYYNSSSRTGQEIHRYDDIILDNRGEAEDVLSRMDELVDNYGLVSVADLNELVGITGNFTDNKYGWTSNIRSASVLRTRDGYMLKLPKAIPLD